MHDTRLLNQPTADSGGLAAEVAAIERRMRDLGDQAVPACEALGLRIPRSTLDSPQGWAEVQAQIGQRLHAVDGRTRSELDPLQWMAVAWLHGYRQLTFLASTRPVWNT